MSAEIIYKPATDLTIGACQPMPALSADDRAALRASISEHGVQVPVEARRTGRGLLVVVDGNNRTAIAVELGLERGCEVQVPVHVVDGLTADNQDDYARRANIARRHLTSAQKRELVTEELQRDAARSDVVIAALCGCSDKTVARVRESYLGTSESAPLALRQS
jgi:ParB-like chromosome segregation protein Spo0J